MDDDLEVTSTPSEGAPSESSSSPSEAPSLRSALEESYAAAEKIPGVSPTTSPNPTQTPAITPPAETVPERFRAKWGDKWATLDPEIKAEFQRWNSDAGRLAQQYGQKAAAYDNLDRMLAPYASIVKERGGSLPQVLVGMLETGRILNTGTPDQKLAMIHSVLQSYGIPCQRLDDGSVRLPTPATPPEMLQRLQTLEQRDLTTTAAVEYNTRAEVSTELDTFLADAAHAYCREPGFNELMADLIRAGRAQGLADAYEQASWLHAKTRPLEIAKQNQAAAATASKVVAQARGAAVSVNGVAPGPVTRDPSKMSLRDTLAAAMDGDLSLS